MKFKKLFITGITLAILLAGSTNAHALFEDKECSLHDAYKNVGIFLASFIDTGNLAEYWNDILEGLKHKHAHRNAIDNSLNKISRMKKAIRDAYLRCDQIAVSNLIKPYYRAEMELFYIRNYKNGTLLTLMKDKFQDSVGVNEVARVYKELTAQYSAHHKEWDGASTADIRELVEALKQLWTTMKESFSDVAKSGKNTREAVGDVIEGLTGGKIKEFLAERMEVRLHDTGSPLTLNDIISGIVDKRLPEELIEIGEQVKKEAKKDFNIEREPGEEHPLEMAEETARKIAESKKTPPRKTLVEIWDSYVREDSRYAKSLDKAQIMARYDTMFRASGDEATNSLVDILEQTKANIQKSLVPLARIAACAEDTEGKQCNK